MSEPWLSIIGIGEDGLHGLGDGSRSALVHAQHVFGGPRHLALADVGSRGIAWPVPFDVAPVLALRGQPVVVLASGDPFWFGAGGSLAAHLQPGEWVAHPAPSTFALAASRLAWRLEAVHCFGLHAAPFERTRSSLHPGAQLLCLLRDAAGVGEFAQWLTAQGCGASAVWVLEALGGPRERIRQTTAAGWQTQTSQHTVRAEPVEALRQAQGERAMEWTDIQTPVAVAVQVVGAPGLPRTPGLPDAGFASDGQITKSPIRALTLAALAPRPGEHLWDLGAGSGSVSVEWCLAGGTSSAVEQHAERVNNIRSNAANFGIDHRLTVHHGHTPDLLASLPTPNAIFVGGGFDLALFAQLQANAPQGTRLVVNAVTLETESALLQLHAQQGGELLRIELAQAAPLGRMRGWQPSRPVVQWSVTL
ncbi:precorrin-6y C5,15-methyltransferase (decarboxylating) subunit CbiE [Rhodoferax aquaticus]|uniref:Precorrin-6y C5,15-methyltransferase (Decarboxylating) subunit CbiE n=1 Tax=Rhodoferax aquaticus TaxID=2527691 RepID=A0A515ENB8_9BURK|nr:precorrin-6y C5,15-methyltransferase (decarboxylating) subunit CbiE [Rhodoferax aquaticus]QDL54124.1 precorrin-6y C5,15-methyltransferase (decarboxylating) subunit CbiE [Rhodoferax aquaticus]